MFTVTALTQNVGPCLKSDSVLEKSLCQKLSNILISAKCKWFNQMPVFAHCAQYYETFCGIYDRIKNLMLQNKHKNVIFTA